jgi:hypothetical protein
MADALLTDPLNRKVVLYDRTWHGHIVLGHPETDPCRALVEEAVRSPEEIRHSRSAADCRVYFGVGPRPGVRIMVVADVEKGVVKTAHLARRISGGPVEWSK